MLHEVGIGHWFCLPVVAPWMVRLLMFVTPYIAFTAFDLVEVWVACCVVRVLCFCSDWLCSLTFLVGFWQCKWFVWGKHWFQSGCLCE